MGLGAKSRQDAGATEVPFRLAPNSGHARVDVIVIVETFREARVPREKAKRPGLGFNQVARSEICIEAKADIHIALFEWVVAQKHTARVVAVFLDPRIGQEVEVELHLLGAREGDNGELAIAETACDAQVRARTEGVAIGFGIGVGGGKVGVLIGIVALEEAGRFLVEVRH